VSEAESGQEPARGARRRVWRIVLTVLAVVLVLAALVAPADLSVQQPAAYLRLPIEGLAGLALVLLLPGRARKPVALVLGVLLGLLTVVKLTNVGFFESLDRPFDPATDWSFFGPGVDFLHGAVGGFVTVLVVIAAVLATIAVVVLMALAVLRITRLVTPHRANALRTVGALGLVWVVLLAFGLQLTPGDPVAARSVATLAYDDVRQAGTDISDEAAFRKAEANDPFGSTPGSQLLNGLRGKNVILAFVESYGQIAVQGSDIAPGIDSMLDTDTKALAAKGFQAKSGFLTSSTFGGGSWLAHSTLESGLWINNQQRYNEFTSSNRQTIAGAFRDAGFRTVADIPENNEDWPEGDVYRYDKVYDSRNVGYQGPGFAYSNMPDQYTMAAYQRLELTNPDHGPEFAEIDLTSSHSPWTHLPHLVPWSSVGNGTIYGPMPAQGQAFNDVWPDPTKIRHAYGQSIQYSLSSLVSYVENYGNDNTVLVFLGDHQPAAVVSGANADRDVPITIVAHDPAVLNQIAGWGWQDGLRPAPNSPVWSMDAFRDKFLTAFSK
jgi:Sulfatase